MTRNLETADAIVKMVLAVSVIAMYFSRVIAGPMARVLLLLSVLVILIFVFKMAIFFATRD